MRVSPIASNFTNRFLKNNINFKADVVILPSSAKDNQPQGDAVILQRETEKIKKELQRRFPSKDDNIQIFLQPTGFRGHGDKRNYWNMIDAFLGYRDSERARQDIIKRNSNPPNEDYYPLQPETIEKLRNKNSELLRKLDKKVQQTSTNYLKDDIEPNIKLHFIDDIEYILKNTLDYGLTEWEKQPVEPLSSPEIDKTKYWLWF